MKRAEDRVALALAQFADPDHTPLAGDARELRRLLVGVLACRTRYALLGGRVVAALLDLGESYRSIARDTGIPLATAHRWRRLDDERGKRVGEQS